MILDRRIISLIAQQHGTPYFLYDLAGIKENIIALNKSFAWANSFRNYFPVKALPRLEILSDIKSYGSGLECCSLPELELARQAGYSGQEIIYTCLFPYEEELEIAKDLGAIINLDWAFNIHRILEKYVPGRILFRLNPGADITGNRILGVPYESKYGSKEVQIIENCKIAMDAGVKEIGLHAMFASNILDINFFKTSAKILFQTGLKILDTIGCLSLINLGGGIGIPYSSDQNSIDLKKLSNTIHEEYTKAFDNSGNDRIRIAMECGRYVTGPNGILVTRLLQLKETYRKFAFVDASATNYPRPGVYGGYNRIDVVNKDTESATQKYDIVGLLCDSCDRFAVQRSMPELKEGDLLVISDAGAHAAAMSYDYNGRLRCNEFLLNYDKTFSMLRRAQSVEEYLGLK